MSHSIKDIANAFSNGNFEFTFPYLSQDITWNIVGENTFKGKADVMANCKQTAAYFASVQTNFETEDIIVSNNKVIIIGTAEFKRDSKPINFVSACDVYIFNEAKEIERISSYCIQENK